MFFCRQEEPLCAFMLLQSCVIPCHCPCQAEILDLFSDSYVTAISYGSTVCSGEMCFLSNRRILMSVLHIRPWAVTSIYLAV